MTEQSSEGIVFVSFECPFCGVTIEINAERLSPEVYIKCICKELIPAGVFYDRESISEQASSVEQAENNIRPGSDTCAELPIRRIR